MERLIVNLFIPIILLFCMSSEADARPDSNKKMITIPAEVIVDKIRGGMLGQIIGNMNGIPYEFKFYDKAGDVQTYTPSLAKGAETDDDADFEWVYLYNMQKERTAFLPYEQINTLWTKSINRGI